MFPTARRAPACDPSTPRPLTNSGAYSWRLRVSHQDAASTRPTDGFFSRPSYLGLLLGVSPNESRINRALELGKVKKLDALLVAHSHHDHAMDAGVVAMKTGAVVVGTRSVSKIAIGSGLPAERIKVVQGGEVIEAGNFRIHVVVSPHSTGTIFPGEIAEPLITPAWLSKYKEGAISPTSSSILQAVFGSTPVPTSEQACTRGGRPTWSSWE